MFGARAARVLANPGSRARVWSYRVVVTAAISMGQRGFRSEPPPPLSLRVEPSNCGLLSTLPVGLLVALGSLRNDTAPIWSRLAAARGRRRRGFNAAPSALRGSVQPVRQRPTGR